jgi:hypothetical protein
VTELGLAHEQAIRLEALRLAVNLIAGTPDADRVAALRTADIFVRYITAGIDETT